MPPFFIRFFKDVSDDGRSFFSESLFEFFGVVKQQRGEPPRMVWPPTGVFSSFMLTLAHALKMSRKNKKGGHTAPW